MNDSQLLKGILEGCVLAIIDQGETYGYDILEKLDSYGFEDIIEGTLYPVLTRLDKKEYISCRKVKSPYGPIRKYFRITEKGSIYLNNFRKDYLTTTQNANKILFKKS